MEKLRYWKCGSCGETLQGIEDADGDFISDKELQSQPIKRLRAVGCYLCGYPHGEFGPEVDDDVTSEEVAEQDA